MATDTRCITGVRGNSPAQWDPDNIPKEMQRIPVRIEASDYPAAFSAWCSKTVSQLNAAVAQTIHSFMATSADDAEVSIVKIGDNQFAAEHYNPATRITTAVVCNTKGQIRGVKVTETGMYEGMKPLPNESEDVFPIYAVYLALLLNTDMISETGVSVPARDAFNNLMIAADPYDEEGTVNIHLLNSTMVSGLDNNRFPCKMSGNNMELLTQESIRLSYSHGQVLCGNPRVFTDEAREKGQETLTAGKAKTLFSRYADGQCWDEEAEKLIPSFPDDYPVLPEVIRIAKCFVKSRGDKRPMNNFLWRGVTAYGKSTGVEMLAYLLHTPLLRLTCSSGMEAQDFLSRFVPDSSGQTPGSKDLPDIEGIMYDPAGAYESITGEYRAEATAQDALEAYGRAREGLAGNGAARFKLVESNYVKALRNGWICEIQEMSRIKDAGTMVTLNEYDRAGALIPLVDGGSARRAENAMVIYTDNVGYSSCRAVDPSVMRRMDLVLSSYELSDEAVKKRVIYNTGCDDDRQLDSMLDVWKNVIDYCRSNEITEGEISVNELERWVACTAMDKSGFMEFCRECVISKASPDRDTQEEIWTRAALPLIESWG